MKRYNLVLPEAMFEEVKAIADAKHTSVAEILRQFIRLGLLACQGDLIFREHGHERRILLL